MAVSKTEQFIANIDRYVFDWGACSPQYGYAQIDTRQDASYYGIWANPTERVIMSFVEGDLYATRCDTDEEFADEMRELQRWNDEHGWGPARIDVLGRTEIAHAFDRVGLADMLHQGQLPDVADAEVDSDAEVDLLAVTAAEMPANSALHSGHPAESGGPVAAERPAPETDAGLG